MFQSMDAPYWFKRQDEQVLETEQAPPECGDDWYVKPHMAPGDGMHISYGYGGHLRWMEPHYMGQLHGVVLRFEADGCLRSADCGVFHSGGLVEKWQDCLLPKGYIRRILTEVVVPIKKSLGVALSPAELR